MLFLFAIFHNIVVKNGIFALQYAVSERNTGKNEKTWMSHKKTDMQSLKDRLQMPKP